MRSKAFRRSVVVVLVSVGVLLGSSAAFLAAVYAASLLEVPEGRVKPLAFLMFYAAMILLAKAGSWLLQRDESRRTSARAVTVRQRLWWFADKNRHWLEILMSTQLGLACAIVAAMAAERHEFGSWAIAVSVMAGWIFGAMLPGRLMARRCRGIVRGQPSNATHTQFGAVD